MKLIKQAKYCERTNKPMFAPSDGVCFSCNRRIPDTDKFHITGCPSCNRTYCD